MKDEKQSRLIPATKWNQFHTWPPIGGIRHIISRASEKKCAHVFLKVSGRWLIDEAAFFEWAHSFGGK